MTEARGRGARIARRAALIGAGAAGLEALRVPTAVVVGTHDLLTPPVHADFMAEVLDRNGVLSGYEIYDGAGHMVPIERAPAYNQLLDRVLADL